MAIKPILFNTEMVRAIQNDRKTVTRRVIKGVPNRGENLQPYHCGDRYGVIGTNPTYAWYFTPPYSPGDILWVRETWSTTDKCGLFPPWPSTGTHYIYKADLEPGHPYEKEARWFPSIHMPRKAARIFLLVKDVRVERLKDIDFTGAVAEGIDPMAIIPWVPSYSNYPGMDMDAVIKREQEKALQKLIDLLFGREIWDSTIKPQNRALYGWDANPPVSVTKFERCEKPENWEACI